MSELEMVLPALIATRKRPALEMAFKRLMSFDKPIERNEEYAWKVSRTLELLSTQRRRLDEARLEEAEEAAEARAQYYTRVAPADPFKRSWLRHDIESMEQDVVRLENELHALTHPDDKLALYQLAAHHADANLVLIALREAILIKRPARGLSLVGYIDHCLDIQPLLQEAEANANDELRAAIFVALSKLYTSGNIDPAFDWRPTIPNLIEATRAANAQVAVAAANSLLTVANAMTGPDCLLEAQRSPHAAVRREINRRLGSIFGSFPAAQHRAQLRAALLAAVHDPDTSVAVTAVQSLIQIVTTEADIDVLRTALQSPQSAVRQKIAASLSGLCAKFPPASRQTKALPGLVADTQAGDEATAAKAIEGLLTSSLLAADLDVLLTLLRGPQLQFHHAIADRLAQTDPASWLPHVQQEHRAEHDPAMRERLGHFIAEYRAIKRAQQRARLRERLVMIVQPIATIVGTIMRPIVKWVIPAALTLLAGYAGWQLLEAPPSDGVALLGILLLCVAILIPIIWYVARAGTGKKTY